MAVKRAKAASKATKPKARRRARGRARVMHERIRFHFQVRPRGVGPAWWPRGKHTLGMLIQPYEWVYLAEGGSWSITLTDPAPESFTFTEDDFERLLEEWYDEHGDTWPWEFQIVFASSPDHRRLWGGT